MLPPSQSDQRTSDLTSGGLASGDWGLRCDLTHSLASLWIFTSHSVVHHQRILAHSSWRQGPMPRGDKSSYTEKQKRQAADIEEGYVKRGVSRREAERRAWATVNKESGGGKKSGSGRGKKATRSSAKKGGRKGGRAAA